MKENMLFPVLNGFAHGGDYNPEQWLDYPDILDKDIELLKKAHINCVTLGIFSWSMFEPKEGVFSFDWMEQIINNLYKNGIYTILATPSAACPAWLDRKYSDTLRVDINGVRIHHGERQNHCLSSENYRRLVSKIDRQLAIRFSSNPAVIMWHISNEFYGFCYCDKCKEKFQDYLREKFDNNINRLNTSWWTSFWSHTYSDFEEIEPPYINGENSILALLQEWKRFTTKNTIEFIQNEIEAVRSINDKIPITTNYIELLEDLDYQEISKTLDVISWDSYPQFHNDYEPLSETFLNNAFSHAVFRSMKKGKPFMMMESAPGIVSWGDFNKYRRPGIHKLACLQAVACGSDSVQYFQIRKSRGGYEQYHGAVIDHMGSEETRIFKEVADTGETLKQIREIAGSVPDNKIGIVFDWNCRWAIEKAQALSGKTKKYVESCRNIWKELEKMGIEPDIVSADGKWEDYKIIIAPMMYVVSLETSELIKNYVSEGGILLATYFSGCVDENLLCHLGGFPGAGLSEVFGMISEETDSLYPDDRNEIVWQNTETKSTVYDYEELIRVNDAEILARYTDDYLKNNPAVTRHKYGKGIAYYVSCRLNTTDMHPLLRKLISEAQIARKDVPNGIEYHVRYSKNHKYEFYLNTSEKDIIVQNIEGKEAISGETLNGKTKIEKNSVLIVKQ